MSESGGVHGSGTCRIDRSPVLSFIGSVPGGTAEQQSGQRPLMQGEVISGKAPHCPPSSNERDKPAGFGEHIKIQSHYPGNYVDRIATVTKKKKGR